jgi:hypothetical protein
MNEGLRALWSAAIIDVERMRRLLGIGRNTAYNAIRRGDVESIRIDGAIRVLSAPLRRKLGLEDAPKPASAKSRRRGLEVI